jgi:predicted nucleotidyltransferase
MDLQDRRDEIIRIATRYGAGILRVFGSVARGDTRPESDVDLLVEMEADRSLLDLVGLGQELEELLQRRVDVLFSCSSCRNRFTSVGSRLPKCWRQA